MIYILVAIFCFIAGFTVNALLSQSKIDDLYSENQRLWTRLHDTGMLDDPMDHGEVPLKDIKRPSEQEIAMAKAAVRAGTEVCIGPPSGDYDCNKCPVSKECDGHSHALRAKVAKRWLRDNGY